MAVPTPEVLVYFGSSVTGAGLFQLNSSLLNGSDLLGGDFGVDVTGPMQTIKFSRGRPSQLFEVMDPGAGVVEFANDDRYFDPLYAAGSLYGMIKPGLRTTVRANGITIFESKVSDWNYTYQVGGGAVASMEMEDALAVLGRQEFDEWTTTAGQTAGARYDDILNRAEVGWSGGARDIDTGVATLQDDLVTWGSNVLNYCQLVAQSDLGFFFASRDGLLTFTDRHSNIGDTPAAVFADDGTGIDFYGVAATFGAEVYYTRVIVDREGGIGQAVTNVSASVDGVRSLTITGLLMDSDSQSLDMAIYLANVYATGDTRLSMLQIALHDDRMTADQVTQVLQLDLTSLVSVKFSYNGVGDPVEQDCIVQGIDHDMSPGSHWVTLWLSKFDQSSVFILNDPTYGKLNSAVAVLAF